MSYLALFLLVNGAKTAYSLLCSSVCLRLINLFTLCCVFGFFGSDLGRESCGLLSRTISGQRTATPNCCPLERTSRGTPNTALGTGNWELGILDSAALICVSHQLATFSAAHRHFTPLHYQSGLIGKQLPYVSLLVYLSCILCSEANSMFIAASKLFSDQMGVRLALVLRSLSGPPWSFLFFFDSSLVFMGQFVSSFDERLPKSLLSAHLPNLTFLLHNSHRFHWYTFSNYLPDRDFSLFAL